MRRLVALLLPFVVLLVWASAAFAHPPTADQLRRMIWGQTSTGWAPDHDVNQVQGVLEAGCDWDIVDRWTLLTSFWVDAGFYSRIKVRYERANGTFKDVTFLGWHDAAGDHRDHRLASDLNCTITIGR